jgi:hypothetical protein
VQGMVHSKECFKCKAVKPLFEFYKHEAMLDGHVNKCKECNKKDVHKNRIDKIDYYREYDRNRAKQPHRIKLALEINKQWRAEDKRRAQCHNAVARAIRKGELVPKNCERCESEKTIAHHEDYNKPLDVMWLCQPCHKQRHKEINNE